MVLAVQWLQMLNEASVDDVRSRRRDSARPISEFVLAYQALRSTLQQSTAKFKTLIAHSILPHEVPQQWL